MGRSRYEMCIGGDVPYVVTCTTVNWIALFGEVRIARILLDSLNFLIKAKRLHLHGYIIMENHVHLVASGQNLAKQIGAFKSFTARSIVDLLEDEGRVLILRQLSWYRKRHKTGQTYQVWQEGSHPEMIGNEEMLNQKLDYIHFNPVRKGYVDDPAHWRYSSYRDYHGGIGLLPVHILGQDTETAEPPDIHSQRDTGSENLSLGRLDVR